MSVLSIVKVNSLNDVNVLILMLLSDGRITKDTAKKMINNYSKNDTAYKIIENKGSGQYDIYAVSLSNYPNAIEFLEYYMNYKGAINFDITNILN